MFIISFNLASCQSKENLVIEFYSNNNDLKHIVKEQDIICFDWEHQSILLDLKSVTKLSTDTSLVNGQVKVSLAGELLYKVDIVHDYSSEKSELASIQFRKEGIFFPYKEWLFIRYLKNDSGYHKYLFDKRLYKYLESKMLMNCKDWEEVREKGQTFNKPDLKPQIKASKIFGKRVN